jgi:hypothetical protein
MAWMARRRVKASIFFFHLPSRQVAIDCQKRQIPEANSSGTSNETITHSSCLVAQ